MQNCLLYTENLSIGYKKNNHKKLLMSNLSLRLEKGKLTALIGTNGSGKSTLLRTLSNLQQAISGEIFLAQKPITSFSPKEIAKYISVVLTDKTDTNLMTVNELVSIGRYPHTHWLGDFDKTDYQKIEQAMRITQVHHWAKENINQLSDGQQQKVWIARALAQDTPLLFLDEPTAHLDVINRLEIFLLLKEIAEKQQKAVLIATHDLAEILQVAHCLWFIEKNQNLISIYANDDKVQEIITNNFTNRSIDYDSQHKNFRIKATPK